MREFFHVAWSRHRLAALVCAALTLAVAVASSSLVSEHYAVEALVFIAEPVAVHRLANPAARLPEATQELAEVRELLMSRDSLVALVKRSGLLDQWDLGRPWALRQKDRLQAAVLGPVSDKDRLEVLVKMLERRLDVVVDGPKVRLTADWMSPDVALSLVQTQLGALMQLRVRREARLVDSAALALDDQYDALRKQMALRAERIETALKDPSGWQTVQRELEQLEHERGRAATLMVQSEEKHIAGDVFRSSNSLRFTVLAPPARPKHPEGLPLAARVLVALFSSALAAVVCVLILALSSGRLYSRGQVERELGLPVRATLVHGSGGLLSSPSRAGLLLAFGLALATGAAVGLSGAQAPSVLPPLAIIALWLVWTRPLKWPLLAIIFVGIIADDPTGRAYAGMWRSPLFAVGRLLFTNIALLTGFELLFYALAGVMVVRRVWADRRSSHVDPVRGQAPLPLQAAVALSAAVIGVLVLSGLARGGIFREALWQFRGLLLLPVVASLLMYALDLPRDLPKLLGVLVVGSVIKAGFGAWFIYLVATPQGLDPPFTSGHQDTMLFVTAAVTAVAMLWEHPSRRTLALALLWLPVIALAIKLNDRRIAYVEIALAMGTIYLLSPWNLMKRFVTRVAVLLLPLVLAYVAVGWNVSNGRFFAPVQKVRSIFSPQVNSEEESSNLERDIENYNIMTTWKENMIIGQGFGHAFKEHVAGYDFGQSNFGHVGHNSILWLLWIGGLLGFTGVLLYLAVALYFLGRTFERSRDWRERAALLVSLSIILTYLLQAFGDMGTQSALIDFFVASAVAIIGRLATRNQAWRLPPAPVAA